MAIPRDQIARPWPCLRVLMAMDALQGHQERAAEKHVCVWAAAVHAAALTTTATFNNATKTLLHRKFIERCYYTGEDKRKKGGYRITPKGRAALRNGWSGKSGSAPSMRPTKGINATIWAAMRVKGKFNLDELQVLCAPEDKRVTTERNLRELLRRYVAALARTGYLMPLAAAAGRFLLVRDTGPLPPLLRARRRQVYDPNTAALHDFEASA